MYTYNITVYNVTWQNINTYKWDPVYLNRHVFVMLFPLSLSFILSTIFYIYFLPFFGKRHKMTHKGWRAVKPKHNQSKTPQNTTSQQGVHCLPLIQHVSDTLSYSNIDFFLFQILDQVQSNLVISNSPISNYRLSRSENLVPILTWNYDNK